MQQYKFYFLDSKDVVITVREVFFKDDLAALEAAETLYKTHAIEICCGHRKVARVNKKNAPLRTEDRSSL